MVKPTRVYIASKEPCTRLNITHTVDRKSILSVLIYELRYKDPGEDSKLKRSKIEESLKTILRYDGQDWFEQTDHDPDVVFGDKHEEYNQELRQRIYATATRLFPDWFPPLNSVRFLKSL